MANHKSAVKRARQNLKRNARNQALRAKARSAAKIALEGILKASSKEEALKLLAAGERSLQKAVSKGVFPKERASRKTSRLAAALNKKFSTSSARA